MKFKRELLRAIKRNKRLLREEKKFLRSLKADNIHPLIILDQCSYMDNIKSNLSILVEIKNDKPFTKRKRYE